MSKYSKRLVNKICTLIRSDEYTIDELCSLSGISTSTYHEWKKTKPDFSDKIRQSEEERKEKFTIEAKKSLLKKIQGYTFIEKKTVSIVSAKNDENGNAKFLTEETITEKHIPSDTKAIIFALTNTDSENWKNRFNNEVTGKGGKDIIPSVDLSIFSDEELSAYRNILLKIAENQTNKLS